MLAPFRGFSGRLFRSASRRVPPIADTSGVPETTPMADQHGAHAGSAGPERILLIASGRTAGPASRQLAVLSAASRTGPRVVGAVVTDEVTGPLELTSPLLGTLDDLPRIARGHRFDRAVICLPIAMTDVVARARRAAEAAGLPAVFMPTPDDVLRGACGSLVGSGL